MSQDPLESCFESHLYVLSGTKCDYFDPPSASVVARHFLGSELTSLLEYLMGNVLNELRLLLNNRPPPLHACSVGRKI